MSGAAPLSPELTMQLVEVLPNAEIGQGYGKLNFSDLAASRFILTVIRMSIPGMTEGAISMFPTDQRIGTLGSVGQLHAGTIARVRKPDGFLAGYDEEGELEVKGPQLALRYTNDEKACVCLVHCSMTAC